ncbi:MAG: hypothetical protein KIT09_27715 [Bryobacteraceae bacterium]|nr:hypothetical protein [Bryobacteraceae bacterium]
MTNRIQDGRAYKYPDPEETKAGWRLRFSCLTDQEWRAIEELFCECEGGLHTFLFLDPSANLLSGTRDMTTAVWRNDPMLAVTGESDDPFGTKEAARLANTGQMAQGIWQALPVPGDFFYCFSLYGRSNQSTPLTLRARTASQAAAQTVMASAEWQRWTLPVALGSPEEEVWFGADIPAGAVATVFGFQVEAQLSASMYKGNRGRGGIYDETRFSSDSLTVVTEGPNQHSVEVMLSSAVET